ncbi:hypothetical protein PIB30_012206 [Stylosanthes scabra]|uniref:F-box domain-containing protein n=1 Tax=Stylosanthes scabra TaxID=79078 RepID=A0ABU6U7S1_9FABA|nr:hypothetical protein [Stylosanthes scabra]
MDRISGLPKGILHEILGRLPDKDAARTCVLSKSWRQTWFSFPILSLCRKNFRSIHDLTLLTDDSLLFGKLDIFIHGYRLLLKVDTTESEQVAPEPDAVETIQSDGPPTAASPIVKRARKPPTWMKDYHVGK